MKRTPFRSKLPERRPARQWEGGTITARSPARVVPSLRLVEPIAKEEPIEHEGYRRLVAALPCVRCGVESFSQAAHPNSDKAKGAKADDRLTFPLCCVRPLEVGCHYQFDQHQLFSREAEASYARIWGRMTRLEIESAGQWPANLPRLEA